MWYIPISIGMHLFILACMCVCISKFRLFVPGVYAEGMGTRRLTHAESINNGYVEGEEELLDVRRERSRGCHKGRALVQS